MLRKKTVMMVGVFVCSMSLLAGCSSSSTSSSVPSSTSNSASTSTSKNSTATQDNTQPAAQQKKGTTTKVGKITSIGGKYYIQENGQQPLGIDSYVVDLSSYVGKTVTISGEYSGDTLFVGSIQ